MEKINTYAASTTIAVNGFMETKKENVSCDVLSI